MAKSRFWWSNLPGERYWCEITDRDKVGDDLLCPQTDESGKPYWSYSLISEIRPGDLIFHYYTPQRAFVGASIAAGTALPDKMAWIPHGTVGRSRTSHAPSRPAWRLPIKSYIAASEPLTLAEVQKDGDWVRDWIADKHASAEIVAAPFQPYPGKLRGYQGYLTKMPLEFVRRWPKLKILADQHLGTSYVESLSAELRDDDALLTAVVEDVSARGGQGFQLSPKARRAIEEFAVQRAKLHYEAEGFTVEVHGKPFDLRCSSSQGVVYVEVKGTTTSGDKVLLTANEVTFGIAHSPAMALFVVSSIQLSSDDPPVATGGQELEIRPWHIETELLAPIAYTYPVGRDGCKD
jgi:sulfur transfer complex TusBCD TusB component (DsrH family)